MEEVWQHTKAAHRDRSRVSIMRICMAIFFVTMTDALATAQNTAIQLRVDLRDAPKKILHAVETLPVAPGPLTLAFPKWIPGEHGPTGPIDEAAGIGFYGNGQVISWRRDPVDMFLYHIDVPTGVTSLEVNMDFLTTPASNSYAAGGSTSTNLAVLSWNTIVLYPYIGSSTNVRTISVEPSIELPPGWQFATALHRITDAKSADQRFATISLEKLIDSPVLAGRFFREVELKGDASTHHFLDMVADRPEDLALSQAHIDQFSRLVAETGVLYRGRHYGSYHFLVTLSDQIAHFGLEHHESSDDRVDAATFIDENKFALRGELLPHELTHSWNGKFRRPDGLSTPNYQVPMVTDMLWVYEGLTAYLGDVLATRCGIWTPEEFRDRIALMAAVASNRPGRGWRPLQDTARMAQVLYLTDGSYENWRLGTDFHDQGELLWLGIDAKIRELTKGTKSLDNFLAKFVGEKFDPTRTVLPYNLEEVIADLNAVAPFDWAGTLKVALESPGVAPQTIGIDDGGYRLEFTDTANQWERLVEGASGVPDTWFSLQMSMNRQGQVRDVEMNGIAYLAGFSPGVKIVSIDGREFSPDLLRYTIEQSSKRNLPIEFIISDAGFYRTLKLDYHGGPRFPRLERVSSAPALDKITESRSR